ncbi:MAG TPA: hypothetical protein PKU82_04500 [Bacteroidia bacterium]|nr:hypothetical protein [Bacteroidia bacterium]HOZ90858.1 hypothetical protein [Bacteroidia bacterium]HRB52041.1 hypothetical protein [Bacteroidia bacterium]
MLILLVAKASLGISQINPPVKINDKFCFDKQSTLELIKSDIKAKSYDSLLLTSLTYEKLVVEKNNINDSIILDQATQIDNLSLIASEKDKQIVLLKNENKALKKENRKRRRKLFFSNFTIVTGVAIGVTTYAVIKAKSKK